MSTCGDRRGCRPAGTSIGAPTVEDYGSRCEHPVGARSVLFARELNGTTHKLEGINARRSASPNAIDEVANRLNGFLRRMRDATTGSPGSPST